MAITTQWMVSPDERDSVAHLPYWKEYSWTHDDFVTETAAAVVHFPMPADCWVLAGAVQITETVDGTAQDFDGLGDDSDPDGWVADGSIVGATAGGIVPGALAAAYMVTGGKHYTAVDVITLTFEVAADVTTGEGKVWLLIGGLTAEV